MSDIQYPETGEKTVNFSATDDCNNQTRGTRMITIIQKLLAGRYVDITESGDTATISVDPSPDYYNKHQINELLADLDTVKFKIVTALPAVGAENVIYLVAKAAPDTGYDQYIWNSDDAQFHAIGDTDIDLSDYYTKLQTYAKTEVYNKTESDDKYQEKLSTDSAISTVTDTTNLSNVNLSTKKVASTTALAIWNYILTKITGSASSVITTDLTRSRAVVTDANSKLNISSVYSAELEQLSGINTTKTVQTQLNEKQTALEEASEITSLADSTPFSRVTLSTNKVAPILASTVFKYMALKIYPVGSIYISMNNTNPATLFGGTWTQIKDRFLLAVGDTYTSANSTGGSATMTITRANLPKVSITTSSAGKKEFNLDGVKGFAYKGGGVANKWGLDYGTKELYENSSYGSTEETASNHTHSFNLNGNVTQTATNNMPPYVTVYMWRRTA